jgi:hypothetical protein
MSTENIKVIVSNFRRNQHPTKRLAFSLSGPHVGENGRIDLREVQESVDLQFELGIEHGPGAPPNVRWATAEDAIWIKHGTGCPGNQGHGVGQFGTPTTHGPNVLRIRDANATPRGESPDYTYLLRVVVEDNGTPVDCEHDPMIINRIDSFR